MSGFLSRLAARSVGTSPALAPRPLSLFEPEPAPEGTPFLEGTGPGAWMPGTIPSTPEPHIGPERPARRYPAVSRAEMLVDPTSPDLRLEPRKADMPAGPGRADMSAEPGGAVDVAPAAGPLAPAPPPRPAAPVAHGHGLAPQRAAAAAPGAAGRTEPAGGPVPGGSAPDQAAQSPERAATFTTGLAAPLSGRLAARDRGPPSVPPAAYQRARNQVPLPAEAAAPRPADAGFAAPPRPPALRAAPSPAEPPVVELRIGRIEVAAPQAAPAPPPRPGPSLDAFLRRGGR
jgi:hypothetical protein